MLTEAEMDLIAAKVYKRLEDDSQFDIQQVVEKVADLIRSRRVKPTISRIDAKELLPSMELVTPRIMELRLTRLALADMPTGPEGLTPGDIYVTPDGTVKVVVENQPGLTIKWGDISDPAKE